MNRFPETSLKKDIWMDYGYHHLKNTASIHNYPLARTILNLDVLELCHNLQFADE